MKKTFNLVHPKIKLARMFDASKHEIKKYMKRERNKAIPEGFNFWDFDCRFGITEIQASDIHPAEFNKKIDEAEQLGVTSFYVEVIAKPGIRPQK